MHLLMGTSLPYIQTLHTSKGPSLITLSPQHIVDSLWKLHNLNSIQLAFALYRLLVIRKLVFTGFSASVSKSNQINPICRFCPVLLALLITSWPLKRLSVADSFSYMKSIKVSVPVKFPGWSYQRHFDNTLLIGESSSHGSPAYHMFTFSEAHRLK